MQQHWHGFKYKHQACYLYASPNIVTIIKLRIMRRAEYATHKGKSENNRPDATAQADKGAVWSSAISGTAER
jgi:hypothetical protein